jgi:hypothetical protein
MPLNLEPFNVPLEIIQAHKHETLVTVVQNFVEGNNKLKAELKRANAALDLLGPMVENIRKAALKCRDGDMTAQLLAQIALEETCPL